MLPFVIIIIIIIIIGTQIPNRSFADPSFGQFF